MIPSARAAFDRIKSAITEVRDIAQIPRWMCEHTSHPHKVGKRWNFDDHEFQVGILEDPARDLVVIKTSQIGMSEIQARWTLGMLAIYMPTTAIYSMPTVSDAQMFAKERLDPIIEGSDVLRALVKGSTDSASLKRLGSSFLHAIGTHGKSAGISIPASILISDELDFSNQRTIQQLESRLGHGEADKFRRYFSTPTFPGYGISRLYMRSSKGAYAVFHRKCGEWVCPQPMEDVLVPVRSSGKMGDEGVRLAKMGEIDVGKMVKSGDVKMLGRLTSEEVIDSLVNPAGTVLLCPHCREVIDENEELAQPSLRKWVHAEPEAERRGYQVRPYDAPKVRSLASSVKSFANYENLTDYLNFAWGEAFQDDTSTVSVSSLNASAGLPALASPRPYAPCFIGVDLGRRSWLVVLASVQDQWHVVWHESVKETGAGNLTDLIVSRAIEFGAAMTVVDAAPDFTTGLQVSERLPGRAFACFYVESRPAVLGNLEIKEKDRTIRAFRTRSLDRMVKEINSGMWKFCRQADENVLYSHLKALKKVKEVGQMGKITERWTHDGPDHYGHACNYARLAAEITGVISSAHLPQGVFSVSRARFGKTPGGIMVPWLRTEKLTDGGWV